MTQSTGERLYRACVRCRKRKTKCDLDAIEERGKPPCKRCHVEGQHCILAGSRRGGDFSRYRKNKHPGSASLSGGGNGLLRDRTNSGQKPNNGIGEPKSLMETAFEGIQNPLDALKLLGEAASEEDVDSSVDSDLKNVEVTREDAAANSPIANTEEPISRTGKPSGLEFYEPVASGGLNPIIIGTLLERYTFRGGEQGDPKAIAERNRLAWTFTYLSDRQISIRMGQAFWCRGPGLSTRFTVDDYPTLKRTNAYEEDFASILQAQVDLTTLFGNAHDILYASKSRTAGLMLRGDYKKYLDDSIRAMSAWTENWSAPSVSIPLECMLEILFQYLRLYVSAFALQAVLSRSANCSTGASGPLPRNCFPHGIIASPDGQNIYLAISAAKKVLTLLIERLDPVKHLRYLPVRFYLYEIHAVMFLFKAFSYGAITEQEHLCSIGLVENFVTKLDEAASGEQHVAFRYSKLLRNLLRQGASDVKFQEPVVDHLDCPQSRAESALEANASACIAAGPGEALGDLFQVSPEDTSHTVGSFSNQTLWPFDNGTTGVLNDFLFPVLGGDGLNSLDFLTF